MRIILINDQDGRLSADFHNGRVMFHVKLWRWSHGKLRQYRRIFDAILARLKGMGYSEVWATPYREDSRAQKLIALFGFHVHRVGPRFVGMRRAL